MIVIRSIDKYRDGGTLSIKCHFGFTTTDGKFDMPTHETEICVDKRMRKKGDGSIWLGYPNKEGSTKIVHQEVLEFIVKKLENHIKYQISYCDEAIQAVKKNIT